MWNVSGISGAAPLWQEIINRLHPNPEREAINPPDGVIRRPIRLPYQMGAEHAEWFIRGTEPTQETIQIADPIPKIIYPPPGAVLAVDADIPNHHQRIFFTCSGCSKNLHWQLDRRILRKADGKTSWRPSTGHHELSLCDATGAIIDTIQFQVRGRNVPISDDSGTDVSGDSIVEGNKIIR